MENPLRCVCAEGEAGVKYVEGLGERIPGVVGAEVCWM